MMEGVELCLCGREPKLTLEYDVKLYHAECWKCDIKITRKTGVSCTKAWNRKIKKANK